MTFQNIRDHLRIFQDIGGSSKAFKNVNPSETVRFLYVDYQCKMRGSFKDSKSYIHRSFRNIKG